MKRFLLPLLLVLNGCSKDPVVETKNEGEIQQEVKPELDGVNRDKIEYRLDDLYYLKGSDAPYTGKVFEEWSGQQRVEANYLYGRLDGLSESWHENGKKASEVNYKDGKQDGLSVEFHENGQKWREVNWVDGELVEGSEKFWNSKGEPVDSMKESFKK